MRCIFLSLILFCGGFAIVASAATTATVTSVRDYGATGDGRALDSAAINAAIAAASAKGGGTVVVPAGTYRCFSVHLLSHITLYLEAGAVILAAEPDAELKEGYDPPEPNAWDQYQDFGHSHWRNSLIWGEHLEDVAILGPGVIDGAGLSAGEGLRDLLPSERRSGLKHPPEFKPVEPGIAPTPGPFGYPKAADTLPAGVGNKAVSLKECRNVILRDFTIRHGGHFAVLATGVDNLTIDNLKVDTNRDGIDIDACCNVRISNCTVNTPVDDAIVLKSSFALGRKRACENVTISNCVVSGYDEGTMLDGTYKETPGLSSYRGPVGRIKLGTESNGAFRNIVITNCIFDCSRGLAIESVDGAELEDIAISNIVMRNVRNTPLFIRLAGRLRGPAGSTVGTCRRIKISHVTVHNASYHNALFIMGIDGHSIEDVSLSDILVEYAGGGTAEEARRIVPEYRTEYPDPWQVGVSPSWGLFARYVRGLAVQNVKLVWRAEEHRPAGILEDVSDVAFSQVSLPASLSKSRIVLKRVERFRLRDCPDTVDFECTDRTDREQP